MCALLDLPQLTVNAMVEVSRSNSGSATERYTTPTHRVGLLCAHKNHLLFVALLTTDFPTAFESNIGIRTICHELHIISFHGQAAAHKPKVGMHGAKFQLEWCKALPPYSGAAETCSL